MNSSKTRVKQELCSLKEKIEKLENFMGKVKSGDIPHHEKLYKGLSKEHKKLLSKQLKVMKQYARILEKRLAIWIED